MAFPDFSSDVSPSFTGPSPRGWWPLSGEPVPAVWSPVPPPHSQSTSGQLGRGRLQGSTQVRITFSIFSCPSSHLSSSPQSGVRGRGGVGGEVVERVQQRVFPRALTIPTLSPNPPSGCNRLYSHRRPVWSSTSLNQPIYRAQGNLISEEKRQA